MIITHQKRELGLLIFLLLSINMESFGKQLSGFLFPLKKMPLKTRTEVDITTKQERNIEENNNSPTGIKYHYLSIASVKTEFLNPDYNMFFIIKKHD